MMTVLVKGWHLPYSGMISLPLNTQVIFSQIRSRKFPLNSMPAFSPPVTQLRLDEHIRAISLYMRLIIMPLMCPPCRRTSPSPTSAGPPHCYHALASVAGMEFHLIMSSECLHAVCLTHSAKQILVPVSTYTTKAGFACSLLQYSHGLLGNLFPYCKHLFSGHNVFYISSVNIPQLSECGVYFQSFISVMQCTVLL